MTLLFLVSMLIIRSVVDIYSAQPQWCASNNTGAIDRCFDSSQRCEAYSSKRGGTYHCKSRKKQFPKLLNSGGMCLWTKVGREFKNMGCMTSNSCWHSEMSYDNSICAKAGINDQAIISKKLTEKLKQRKEGKNKHQKELLSSGDPEKIMKAARRSPKKIKIKLLIPLCKKDIAEACYRLSRVSLAKRFGVKSKALCDEAKRIYELQLKACSLHHRKACYGLHSWWDDSVNSVRLKDSKKRLSRGVACALRSIPGEIKEIAKSCRKNRRPINKCPKTG